MMRHLYVNLVDLCYCTCCYIGLLCLCFTLSEKIWRVFIQLGWSFRMSPILSSRRAASSFHTILQLVCVYEIQSLVLMHFNAADFFTSTRATESLVTSFWRLNRPTIPSSCLAKIEQLLGTQRSHYGELIEVCLHAASGVLGVVQSSCLIMQEILRSV